MDPQAMLQELADRIIKSDQIPDPLESQVSGDETEWVFPYGARMKLMPGELHIRSKTVLADEWARLTEIERKIHTNGYIIMLRTFLRYSRFAEAEPDDLTDKPRFSGVPGRLRQPLPSE